MPNEGIFLVRGDDDLVEMTEAHYESEDVLQRLLATHPNILAGGQMTPGAPRRWLLVTREMPVPKQEGGSGHWSLDHLFLDQDGVPTVVEVKRSTDTRIRREVVGQMLDYAANGVRYWPVEQLRAACERQAAIGEVGESALAEFLGPDGDEEAFWVRVRDNLRAGRVRMVFVADVIPQELQRIVEFLNEQMSPAEVLGVEVKQFVAEGLRTLVPKVIGMTATARDTKGTVPKRSFEQLLADADPAAQEFDRRLAALVERLGLVTRQTPAARQVYTRQGVFLFHFYPGWSSLEFTMQRIRASAPKGEVEAIVAGLEAVAGKKLTEKHPYLPCSAVLESWESFERDVLPRYIAAREAAEARFGSFDAAD